MRPWCASATPSRRGGAAARRAPPARSRGDLQLPHVGSSHGQGERLVQELSCMSHAPAYAVEEVDCVLFWRSHSKVLFSRSVRNTLTCPVDVPPEMPPIVWHTHVVVVALESEGEPGTNMNDFTL